MINADGARLRRITPGDDWYPAWSPDGQWIAFWRHAELPESIHPLSPPEPIDDLFLVRPDGSALTRITSGRARDMMPNWSPDGTQIVFVTDRSGGGIATMSPSGDDIRILSDGGRDPFWSPDGARIGFVRYSNTSARIYSIRADGSDLQVIVGHANGAGAPIDCCPHPSWQPVTSDTSATPSVTTTKDPEASSSRPKPGVDVGLSFRMCDVER